MSKSKFSYQKLFHWNSNEFAMAANQFQLIYDYIVYIDYILYIHMYKRTSTGSIKIHSAYGKLWIFFWTWISLDNDWRCACVILINMGKLRTPVLPPPQIDLFCRESRSRVIPCTPGRLINRCQRWRWRCRMELRVSPCASRVCGLQEACLIYSSLTNIISQSTEQTARWTE